MNEKILNRDLLPGNECFGCGHENPHGLQIEVVDEADAASTLAARFEPPDHATGFPGLTHGGALFTAMDCLATWVVVLFGPNDDRYWLLGSADVSFRRAASVGERLELSGRLVEQGSPEGSEQLLVRIRIRTADGQLVAEGDFEEVPVSPEKFKHVAEVAAIPEPWKVLFEDAEATRGG